MKKEYLWSFASTVDSERSDELFDTQEAALEAAFRRITAECGSYCTIYKFSDVCSAIWVERDKMVQR